MTNAWKKPTADLYCSVGTFSVMFARDNFTLEENLVTT